MATVGFLGLGNMGGPMAANLVKAGHAVHGFDLVSAACVAAAALGVRIADDPEEAVRDADIVITMLPNGALVTSLYARLLPVAKPGTLFIDSSTIDVASARAAHEAATTAGMFAVDAPVSGGVVGAAAGTLTFMLGGDAAALKSARPILAAMGRTIVACGGPGSGQAAKLCNNMILGISMIAVSEAFVLAETLGLSHEALFAVASTSSAQCWALTTNCPVPGQVADCPADHDYTPGFSAALMLKDLRLSQQAAAASGADTPLGQAASRIYAQFVDAGGSDTDFSGIIKAIRIRSGSEPGPAITQR